MMTERAISPVVHVGYPKCASTTLQKQLFNRHPQITSLGIFPTKNVGLDTDYVDTSCPYLADEHVRAFHYNLVMLSSLGYLRSSNAALFERHLRQYTDNDRVTVLSNERLASVYYCYGDIVVKGKRIKDLFPEAKILIVIRNQLDLIVSQYRDRPFDPRSFDIGRPVGLNRWMEILWETPRPYFLESLRFLDIAQWYADAFGSENVQVLLLEDLNDDLLRFSELISSFMGIDPQITRVLLQGDRENRGVSRAYNMYRALRRRFLSLVNARAILPESVIHQLHNLESGVTEPLKARERADYSLSGHWVAQLSDYYAESNRRLEEQFRCPLASRGYPA